MHAIIHFTRKIVVIYLSSSFILAWYAGIQVVASSDKITEVNEATKTKGLRGKLNKVVLAYSDGLNDSQMNFYLKYEFFLMYFKIPYDFFYDFTICFYDPSLWTAFRFVLKSRF